MFFLWVIRILIIVAIITVVRNFAGILGNQELKRTLYQKVRGIPVAGKILVLIWRLVKRVALALWATVVWISKLPVIRTLVAIPVKLFNKLKGVWLRLLAWSETD